jgi:ELWxxDGT repeat protein
VLVRTAAALLLVASATGAYAQSPYRIRDIHPGPASSEPQTLLRAGEVVVFTATDDAHGEELWRSDGTREGTFLLADLVPGPDGGSLVGLATVGEVVYFSARPDATRGQLWKTDGSIEGTLLVKEWIEPTAPVLLVGSGSTLFFRMATAAAGAELWKSDGTAAGTTLVRDISPGAASSNPTGLRAFTGGIVFAAVTPASGAELWKSDGTAAGTVLVRELASGSASSSPITRAVLGGLAFFTANVPGTGVETWVTDGTAAGTRLLADLNPGAASSQPADFAVSQGSVYFSATEPLTGRELYRSDGTTAGTVRVIDLVPGPASSFPSAPVEVGALTMFAAQSAAGGRELHRTDGSAAGTVRVKDINPGPGGSDAFPLGVLSGVVYLSAFDEEHGYELWRSDGTETGTEPVADLNPGPSGSEPYLALAIGDRLTFVATDGTSGWEPWAVDAGGPEVDAGPDQGVEAGEGVLLEGSAVDPQGDPLTFEWRDASDLTLASTASASIPLPLGAHVLTLVASDGTHRGSDSLVVRVGQELELTLVSHSNGEGRVASDLGDACASTGGNNEVCRLFHPSNAVVTLTATPGENSTFLGWGGACSGAGSCQVTMDGTQSVEAVFRGPSLLSLAIDSLLGGSGSILVEPPGELCELSPGGQAFCEHSYPAGTVVVLSPVPASGSAFGGWIGDTCTGTGSCTFTANDYADVSASFAGLRSLQVDVSGAEGGQGSLVVAPPGAVCAMTAPDVPEQCTHFYDQDETVTVTASAASGSVFAGWTGACSGSGPCAVGVTGHQTVGAIFRGPAALSLTVDGALGGGGSVRVEPPDALCAGETGAPTACQYSFARGTAVQLTPLPAAGSAFGGWNGTQCTGTGACALVVEENAEISARFVGRRSLRVDIGGTGGGQGAVSILPPGADCAMSAPDASVQCSYFYAQDETVTLLPTAAEGSGFAGWTGACSGTGPCTVAVDGHEIVGATFEGPRGLTVLVEGLDGVGSVTIDPPGTLCAVTAPASGTECVQTYPHGGVVTLTANPGPNSAFEGWSGISSCPGTGTCTVVMDAHRSVTARFVGPRSFRLEVWGEEGGQGSIVLTPGGATCTVTPNTFTICDFWFLPGEVVTVTPVPAPGARLAHWFGDCTGNGPCSVTMGSSAYVRASFYGPPTLGVRVHPLDEASGMVTVDPPGSTCATTTPGMAHDCEWLYPYDTVVTLTPAAPPGSTFLRWGDFGPCSGSGPCTVTMSASTVVSALFVRTNQPPTVALTSPVAGSVYPQAPASVTLAANAADTDGSIARVEFFANGTKVGERFSAPFGLAWTAPAAGAYALTARATDDDGAVTDSAIVPVIVNAAPTLVVTSPLPDAPFAAPATVALGADASDPDGAIVRVEFFEGAVSRGFDTTSPYAVVWSSVPAGVHTLTAVATDDRGATTSVAFTVVVSARVAPAADAYVRDGEPFHNFGTEERLHVRKAAGSNNNRWTYVRFDVAALSSVSAATLRLFGHLAEETAAPVNALVFPVANTSWNERTITWHNKPAAGGTAVAFAALDTATTDARWYEWDLTAYVQAEKAAGRNVITLAIRNDVVTPGRAAFRSREANQNRPELLLTP